MSDIYRPAGPEGPNRASLGKVRLNMGRNPVSPA